MKIGSGSSKTTEDKRTFISVALKTGFKDLCPIFKTNNLEFRYISAEERKSEKSPAWNVYLINNEVQSLDTITNEETKMKIGSAWTRTRKDDGKTFISVALDDEFKELCPQLRNCNLTLSHISAEERKSEKAPNWTVNLIKNKEMQPQNTADAEKAIQQEAAAQTNGNTTAGQENTVIGENEIPY